MPGVQPRRSRLSKGIENMNAHGMFKVKWLKDGIGRKAGDTFEMSDRTLFEAWRDDEWCSEVRYSKAEEKAGVAAQDKADSVSEALEQEQAESADARLKIGRLEDRVEELEDENARLREQLDVSDNDEVDDGDGDADDKKDDDKGDGEKGGAEVTKPEPALVEK